MEQTVTVLAGGVIAFVIALFVRRFVLWVALVSSCSMLPSLKPGHRILAARVYRFDRIERGDIVFFFSREIRQTLIKRVIGLPGDLVEIRRDGAVFVNRKRLHEPYVEHAGGPAGAYRVPVRRFFLLGDNRARSKDSRHWKETHIPEKDILGKAILRLYPPGRL